jgi:DDE superfamily endonuclease
VEKNLRRRVRRLKNGNPGKAVEVWAEDEARLGLKPITRRVWWLRGHRPGSSGRTKYEWLYVYGFVRPRTGASFTVIQPRVRVEPMAAALAAFAAHADPGGAKILVLVVDNAGWHRARRLAVPANVRLHFLPPCTPELQPAEPFWVLVREGVANDTFDRLGQLRRVIRRRCRRLAADTATVYGAVGFRWAANLEG